MNDQEAAQLVASWRSRGVLRDSSPTLRERLLAEGLIRLHPARLPDSGEPTPARDIAARLHLPILRLDGIAVRAVKREFRCGSYSR